MKKRMETIYHMLQYLMIAVAALLCLATYILVLQMKQVKWYEIADMLSSLAFCIICQFFLPHILVIATAVKALRGKRITDWMIATMVGCLVLLSFSYILSYLLWIECPVRPMFWIVYLPLSVMAGIQIAVTCIYRFKMKSDMIQ